MRADFIRHSKFPDWLDGNGQLKLLPTATFDASPRDVLRYWCFHHARYGVPTAELVEWLKILIGGRKAIEIGSGSGDLAHHLGITATDSWMQAEPDVQAYYAMVRQPTVQYPAWVEKIDALSAIEKYQPDIVIGSWITHWIDPNQPSNGMGSIYGVKENLIIERGITYILLGNLGVHEKKPIRQIDHHEVSLPFLCSRAFDRSLDRLMIWNM